MPTREVVGVTAMSGKTCLVTGATSGVGKATAVRLAELGATVISVARDQARGEAAADEIRRRAPQGRVETMTADLSSLAQVRALAGKVVAEHQRLDVLVNNASVITLRRRLTPEGLETAFATNHLGPFLLTNLLRELLERSAPARVVTVASAAHKGVRAISWEDLPYGREGGRFDTYPITKLLNVLFTFELARRLAGTGVTATCLHPGFVRTDIGREATGAMGVLVRLLRPFQSSPETGAKTSIYLASSPEVASVTGRYFVKCKPAEPGVLAKDRDAAARLWTLSENLSGLDPDR